MSDNTPAPAQAPAPAPAPAATASSSADAGTRVIALDFVIHIPDLRNGALEDIQQAAPKSSVAREYKWAAIEDLPASESVKCVEYIIRATYATLLSSTTGEQTEAVTATARRRAIVLGSVRAGAAAAYNLTRNDMTITECCRSGFKWSNDHIRTDGGSSTAVASVALANGMRGLDATEVEVISALVYLGMAVPALQGVSLVASGHHYLPTTKNVFTGQKRQALGLLKDAGRAWIETMGDDFDDMAFHKACHPISPPFKRRTAKQASLAGRLQMSGHGSAAIRIPAIPSDAQIGKTGLALLRGATATIHSMGHTISTSRGEDLMRNLEATDEGRTERDAVAAIQSWAAAHVSSFAFCAGIVQAVHESTGTGRNTLLAAYSVKKIMSEHASEVNRGTLYARAAAQRVKDSLAAGTFADPAISA